MSHPQQVATPTVIGSLEPPKHPAQSPSAPVIETWHDVYNQDPERDALMLGQNFVRENIEVDSWHVPDFTPAFGVIDLRMQNQKNTRRSTLTYLALDTLDLFEPKVRSRTLDELGGKNVTRTLQIVDATGGLPAPTADALLVVEATTKHFDRAHAIKETTVVESWAELETTIETDPDAGGNKSVETRQVVAPGTTVPTGSDVISAQLRELSETKAMLEVKRAPNGFRDMVSTNQADPDAFGSTSTETVSIKDLSYIPSAPTWLTIDQKLVDGGNGKLRFSKKEVASWPVFIDVEEEPETGKKVTIRREILETATLGVITYGEARKTKTLKNLDPRKVLFVTREVDSSILSLTQIEYHNVSYYFPAYLSPDQPFSIANPGYDSAVTSNRASDHTFKLPCRFEITYHATLPTVAEVFQFKPIDLKLDTSSFTLTENDVLTDGGILAFYSNGFPLTFNIPASSPTATEYLAMMTDQDEVLIADDMSKWKFNLWKRIKVYMTMPDISQTLGGYLTY